jgi:hypothetical protein
MKYNVPLLTQSVSPICWVVSAAMIQKYWQQTAGGSFDTTLLTGGADPSNSCIPGSSSRVAQYNSMASAGFVHLAKPASNITLTQLNRYLSDFGPLMCDHFCANFNYGAPGGGKQPANAPGAHAVVITGLTGNYAFINNPWGHKDAMIPAADLVSSINQAYTGTILSLSYAAASPMPGNVIY